MPRYLLSLCVTLLIITAQALPTSSLYTLPPLQLSDQDGQRFSFASRAGHPYLLAMFYASCTQACPMQIASLRHLQKFLIHQGRPQPEVLLISFDSRHDTTSRLHQLATERHLQAPLFTLARVEEGDLGMLAAVLGISWHRRADGQFQHTSKIVLIDAQGDQLDTFDDDELMQIDVINRVMTNIGGQALPLDQEPAHETEKIVR